MVYKCTSPKLLAEKVGFLLSDEWMCLLHRSLFFYKFEKEWGVSRGSAMWALCAPLFFPSLPLWLGAPRTRAEGCPGCLPLLASHTPEASWLARASCLRRLLFSLHLCGFYFGNVNQWSFPVQEFCVLKILYYCKKDIQHGFMSDSRLETFENSQMCRYFWSMFQKTTSYIKIRSGTAFSHQPQATCGSNSLTRKMISYFMFWIA